MITAFDAYGSLEENPSAALVRQLRLDDDERREILPTSYRRGWRKLRGLLRDEPTAIVMFGYSRRVVDGLRLEAIAHNHDRFETQDNDGRVGRDWIIKGAPAVLKAAVPIRTLREALIAEGVPVNLSDDAGGFVCNHLYYKVLAMTGNRNTRCIFVHVGKWKDSENAHDLVRGAQLLVRLVGRPGGPGAS